MMKYKIIIVFFILINLGCKTNSVITSTNKIKISGFVKSNQDGYYLPAANITNLNTKEIVSSDMDGKYEILAKESDILLCEYFCFEPQRIKITKSKNVFFYMESNCKTL